MFTFEVFKSLAGITDHDELMSAVSRIPEEDLRTALFDAPCVEQTSGDRSGIMETGA